MAQRLLDVRARGLLGVFDLNWPLTAGVNILSGVNGSGKSTLLRAVAEVLRTGAIADAGVSLVERLDVTATSMPISVVANFDILPIDNLSLSDIMDDRRAKFYDIVDNLFHATGKRIDRKANGELRFALNNLSLPVGALSSGERKVLRLFVNILLNPTADVLILDEPEISLQIEWQQVLLEYILILNPDVQILVATHSPSIVMNGWVNCVSEISSLITKH